MSRQSKAAKRKIIAQQYTQMHLQGQRGPSKTTPKHNKFNTELKKKRAEQAAKLAAAAAQAERDAKKKPAPQGKGGSKYAQKKTSQKPAAKK